ncbi:hypothetical protein E2C01_072009 [Portunus trituberculatus]|uniref:GH18 domain-containing protein n=1 Tax=Portunus trituberculatus TaxID=210409 RepID=A0A5B7I1G2_PORTR|nr:hypothetical protein [Portunus trituberculatus]
MVLISCGGSYWCFEVYFQGWSDSLTWNFRQQWLEDALSCCLVSQPPSPRQAEYANMRGLAGVMIWDVTTDDFGNYCQEGRNPLITAVSNALQGTTTTTTTTTRPSTTTSTTTPTPKPTQQTETKIQTNIPSRQNAAKEFTLSPCIVRFSGRMHCPWDFTTTRGTTTATPRRVEDESTTSQTAYPWQAW